MHITWHGAFTVKIQTPGATVVIDPAGLRAAADIAVLSHPADASISNLKNIKGNPIVLIGPGEYNVGEITIHAIPWRAGDGSQRTIQRFAIERLTLLNLATLDRDLTDTELQEIEKSNLDVLLIPVGGNDALNHTQAVTLITTLEPRLVIPIAYQNVKLFAEEMGIKATGAEKKIVIKPNRLPKEDMETVILKPA